MKQAVHPYCLAVRRLFVLIGQSICSYNSVGAHKSENSMYGELPLESGFNERYRCKMNLSSWKDN